MIISIDHGNKQIKTAHKTFVSGIVGTDVRPALGEEFVKYADRYYSLTERRLSYQRDKTMDDAFLILSLFGIAYEILAAGAYTPGETLSVDLLIGLPPAHFGSQYNKFEHYFKRGFIDFEFGERPFSVYINSVTAYPQAYAAAMTVFNQIRQMPKCAVIDIGGFTTDYMLMKYGAPDMSSCSSLEHGVIVLYNRIISEINSAYDLLLDETDIDSVLRNENDVLSYSLQESIHKHAQAFVEELFSQLRERMIDLRVTKAVFVGGGSILLKPYIEKSAKVGSCIFVSDINANAKGYELLYKIRMASKEQA